MSQSIYLCTFTIFSTFISHIFFSLSLPLSHTLFLSIIVINQVSGIRSTSRQSPRCQGKHCEEIGTYKYYHSLSLEPGSIFNFICYNQGNFANKKQIWRDLQNIKVYVYRVVGTLCSLILTKVKLLLNGKKLIISYAVTFSYCTRLKNQ